MDIALITPEPLTNNFAEFEDLDNPNHVHGWAAWTVMDLLNGNYQFSVSGKYPDGTPFDLFELEHTSSEYPTPGQVFLLIAQAIQKAVGGNDAK